MNKSRIWISVLIFTLSGFVACAFPPMQTRAPAAEFEEQKIFAPGDCFQLVAGGYTNEFTILADGTIALPLLSYRLKVVGLTPHEVANLVAESYQPDGPDESAVKVLPCSAGSRR